MCSGSFVEEGNGVLILILLEYIKWTVEQFKAAMNVVLILILLEYIKCTTRTQASLLQSYCLNPYSTGIH